MNTYVLCGMMWYDVVAYAAKRYKNIGQENIIIVFFLFWPLDLYKNYVKKKRNVFSVAFCSFLLLSFFLSFTFISFHWARHTRLENRSHFFLLQFHHYWYEHININVNTLTLTYLKRHEFSYLHEPVNETTSVFSWLWLNACVCVKRKRNKQYN